jgi:hypothetical protein
MKIKNGMVIQVIAIQAKEHKQKFSDRHAFGDFVLELYANCLIFHKYGNPEPAKASS